MFQVAVVGFGMLATRVGKNGRTYVGVKLSFLVGVAEMSTYLFFPLARG